LSLMQIDLKALFWEYFWPRSFIFDTVNSASTGLVKWIIL
jgi:hypothetical protein